MAVPKQPEWLRAGVKSSDVGVDRENNVVLGYVVAQEGPFKSQGRGEFDAKSLKKIVSLMRQNKQGTKARFGHPTLSDDGLGKYLGRAKNPRLDSVTVERDGDIVSLLAVRADLHIADVAMAKKSDDSDLSLGEYVLRRAEDDSESFSSSLVLATDVEYRLDKDGRPETDANGDELPPLWRPLRIHASDVVDTGDAVDGFLSADFPGLPDHMAREASQMLSNFLPGESREVVEARLQAFLSRALDWRFGDEEPVEDSAPRLSVEDAERRINLIRRRSKLAS